MRNALAIMNAIKEVCNFILNIFTKGKRERRKKPEDKFVTPPRTQPRPKIRAYEDGTVPGKKVYSDPACLPSRLPESFPLIKHPSDMNLPGSRRTPLKLRDVRRSQRIAPGLRREENGEFDPTFLRNSFMNASGDTVPYFQGASNSSPDFHSIGLPSNNRGDFRPFLNKHRIENNVHPTSGATTSNSFRFDSTEERGRRFTSDSKLHRSTSNKPFPPTRTPSQSSLLAPNSHKNTPLRPRECPIKQGSSTNLQNFANDLLNFNGMESNCTNARTENLRHFPANKESESSGDFFSAIDVRRDRQLNESPAFPDGLNFRPTKLKHTSSTPGCSRVHKKHDSKIPISNLKNPVQQTSPKREEFPNMPTNHRTGHTHSSGRKFRKPSFPEKPDVAIEFITPDDIDNWFEYREDTSAKFERNFIRFSKNNKRPNSNIIYANSHSQWLRLARIGNFDANASKFKTFAGRKIVMTLKEYKLFIHKTCAANELDYWDILRTMGNFEEDEVQFVNNITFDDIEDWFEYRNETNVKFERSFRHFSKKKKKDSDCSAIDANSHSRWLRLAKIAEFDANASSFKAFAGGKALLTLGEYKFLILKICTASDIDYLDIVGQMSIVQGVKNRITYI